MTPKKHAAGAVVYRRTPEGPRFLVIYDAYGHWTFPKGHLEADESSAAAARREVAEETVSTGTSDRWSTRFSTRSPKRASPTTNRSIGTCSRPTPMGSSCRPKKASPPINGRPPPKSRRSSTTRNSTRCSPKRVPSSRSKHIFTRSSHATGVFC